jgi:GntR family transcriptional regulator
MTGDERPIYLRISEDLEARILSGELAPGDRVPSERQLSEEHGASRMTIRQALRMLADRGLVETRNGLGTFVGHRRIEEPLDTLSGFTEAMARKGLAASSLVLGTGTAKADEDCARALGVADRTEVHRLVRVRLVDGEPVALETTEIPVALVPDLFDLADFGSSSLYAALRAKGIAPTTAEQRLSAGRPDRQTALALRIPEDTPVLLLSRRTADQRGRPIEFVRSTYRGDTFVMTARLSLERPP